MLAFGDFCAQQGAHSLAQVGERHVIRYWRSEMMQQLSDRTRGAHFYALATLWRLAGKHGSPPKPFPAGQRLPSEHMNNASAMRSCMSGDVS